MLRLFMAGRDIFWDFADVYNICLILAMAL